MGFFKKLIKPVGKVINAVPGGSTIASAIAAATGQAYLIPAIQGASTVGKGGSLLAGLGSAAGSYLGGQIGGSLTGKTIGGSIAGNIGKQAALPIFSNLAGTVGGNAAGNILSTNIGAALGSYAGSGIGEKLGGGIPEKGMAGPPQFSASRAELGEAPAGLSGGGLNENQQSSNLATQGVYGGGLGEQENDYFLNLVNRRLVDESGQVGNLDSVNPIEKSYLQQLGYSGYENPTNLLEAISKRKRAA